MAPVAVSTGLCICTWGTTPSVLNGTSNLKVMAEGRPICVLSDIAPQVNIRSFGMCSSMANPAVAAATAKNLGVLEPQPCIPSILSPWISTQFKVLVSGQPAVTVGSTCICAFAGKITVVSPGQVSVSAG